uniref:Uncharacterized protein n=1 Tax=Lepeophtheirus salmonis TaxID=72036 RepID=A0A0K2UQF4_LEPSM
MTFTRKDCLLKHFWLPYKHQGELAELSNNLLNETEAMFILLQKINSDSLEMHFG